MSAGVLHDFVHPICGCDACDETARSQADELEHEVLSVAAGGYRERVRGRATLWIDMELRSPDGSRAGSTRAPAGLDRHRLAVARRRLRSLPQGWRPWPVRTIRNGGAGQKSTVA